jgi:hypothetical protein
LDGGDQSDRPGESEEVLESRMRKIFYIKQKRRKANWIGHILLRNCLLEHVTVGKIERMVIGGKRRKQLLDNLHENRGYWKV